MVPKRKSLLDMTSDSCNTDRMLPRHIRDNIVRENKKWYDDVVIATSYVGPMVKAK